MTEPDRSDTRAFVITEALAWNALAIMGDDPPHAARQIRERFRAELGSEQPTFMYLKDDDLEALSKAVHDAIDRRREVHR